MGDRALELALRLGDESTRAHALTNLGTAAILQDHRETAALLEAHAIADAAGVREEGMRGVGNLGYTLMCWVQPEPAARYLQRALDYAQAHELHNLAPYYVLNLAWLRVRAGEWDEAERVARGEIERGSTVVQLVAKIILTELAVRGAIRTPPSCLPTSQLRPIAQMSCSGSDRSSSWRQSGRCSQVPQCRRAGSKRCSPRFDHAAASTVAAKCAWWRGPP